MVTLSLDYLSVVGVSPTDYVDIAAEAGFDAITPFGGVKDGPLPAHVLRVGDPETEAMKRRLKERGLVVNNVDGLVVMPGVERDDLERMIDVALHLGARAGVTLIFDPDPARAADGFNWLCETARRKGLPLLLEFTAMSEIKSLAAALAFIERSGEDIGLVIDVLHLSYAKETPDQVAALQFDGLISAQICDGPANPSVEAYGEACMFNRAAPGDGELPVTAFLAALPEDVPVGVEAPLRPLMEQGVSPLERARLLERKARACLAAAGRA